MKCTGRRRVHDQRQVRLLRNPVEYIRPLLIAKIESQRLADKEGRKQSLLIRSQHGLQLLIRRGHDRRSSGFFSGSCGGVTLGDQLLDQGLLLVAEINGGSDFRLRQLRVVLNRD